MAARELPGLGLQSDWALGENGWKVGMDANLLMLSILVNSGVDSFVGTLPPVPAEGDLHILSAGGNINKLALFDQTVWKLYTPISGWRVYLKDVKRTYVFDGTAWVREQSDGIVELTVTGGTVNAIQATIPDGLTVEDTRFFYIDIPAEDANTAPVTIAINGDAPIPMKNISNDDFLTGEFQGRLFFSNETDRLQALIDAGAAAAAAASAALAQTWAEASEAVALPDGSIAEPKYITDSVSRRALAPDAVGPDELDEEAVLDAHVAPTAAIRSSKLAFSQNEADTVSFPYRPIYHRLRERISVMDPAPGNIGVADHTMESLPWWQEAIDYAQTRSLKAVHVPTHEVSSFYDLRGGQLLINKPMQLIGEHPMLTVGNTTLGGGNYMIRVDGTDFPNLEQVNISNMTIRPGIGTGAARGIHWERCANIVMRDVILFGGQVGMWLSGDRSYGNNFENVHITGATGTALLFDSFTGGGQHNFSGCAINGAVGLQITSNCRLSALRFDGCAWEGCGQPITINGWVEGITLDTPYFEKNGVAGGYMMGLNPAAGNYIRGFVGDGGIWETDAEDYAAIIGGAGVVSNVRITEAATDGLGLALTRSAGGTTGGVSGVILENNWLQNLAYAMSPSFPAFTDVHFRANRGNAGAVVA